MKAYGEVGIQIHVFSAVAVVRSEWSASRPGRFSPAEKTLSSLSIGGWLGPRTGVVEVERRKILPIPGLELRLLDRLAHSQSLYRLSYPGSLLKKRNSKYQNAIPTERPPHVGEVSTNFCG
jgi:hypothetical protein